MKFFNSKYLKYFITLLIFAVGCALTYKSWYFSFKPITFGDTGFLYKEFYIDLFNTLSPTWNAGINFGVNSASVLNYFGYNFWGGLLAKIGLEYNVILRFIMLYPLLIGFIVSTFLISRIFKGNVIATLIFGFVFAINTFIFAWLNMMVAYSFLPLVVLTLYEYLNTRKSVWLLIFSLFFAATLFYEIRIGFIVFLLSVMMTVFYWIYNPLPKKLFIKQVTHLAFSLGIVFLLGAFFMFPLLNAENYSSISGITSQSLFGKQFYGLQYSLSFMQPYWNGEALKVFFQQPIKFYFWIFPILAFSALFFAKRDKKIIYFSLIAVFGIFMGKGSNVPFGFIYSWLYYNLPFFNFFREPLQWWVIIGFSYAVLIAYFFYYSYQEIEKFVKRKLTHGAFVGSFIKTLVALPIIFVVLSIAIPAYDGRLGHGLNPVVFAKEYESLRQFLLNDKPFYRTLSIPTNQRFTYFSNNHPYIAYNYLPYNLKSLSTKILSLESIRYVIVPVDVLTDVFVNTQNNKQYENFVETAKSSLGYNPLKRIAGFGNIKMWENPNDSPHLMTVKDLVYVGGPPNLSELIDMPTLKQVAYYLEQDIPLEATQPTRDIITKTNDTMYKNATKVYMVASCVRCDLSKKYLDYVQYPFARFLSDSVLYPLVEKKENKILDSLASPAEKFKMEAFFAEKRVAELQKMKETHLTERKYKVRTFLTTSLLLDDMEKSFKAIDDKSIDNGYLATWDYLYTARKTLDDMYVVEKDNEIASLLSNLINRLEKLTTKVSEKVWITKGNQKKLTIDLREDGDYKILLKHDEEASMANAQLIINGNSFQQILPLDNGYVSYGNNQIQKGQYLLQLDTPFVNLLELTPDIGEISETNSIKIRSLKDPLSQYQLSFDYKIAGERSGRVFISDDAFPLNSNSLNGNLIMNEVLQSHRDEQWYHVDFFFSPYTQIKNPVLHLKGENEESGAVYKNFSLTKVVIPTIVFVKDSGKVLDVPKIEYQEITSTDYILKIENAKTPFVLSFSEQYDGNWSMLSTDKKGFYGNNSTVSKYFDGNVTEVAYANRIEPALMVDSLVNERKVDSLHLKLNGFSNGWFINEKGTYQIHLTFSPQKYFIIGLIVSGSTLIAVLLAIGFLVFKNKKRKSV